MLSGKLAVDWNKIVKLSVDPTKIPDEVMTKGLSWTQHGKPTLFGPGKTEHDTLNQWRQTHRRQELEYDLAGVITRAFANNSGCTIPSQKLFPQVLSIVHRFSTDKVELKGNSDIRDVFANPYFGWAVQNIIDAIQPATSTGAEPEVPIYERGRGPGSTSEVDFWTAREVKETEHSHVNYVVADTKKWEQSAAYYLDSKNLVQSFVKNEGLGFAIKYHYQGEPHEYTPDFLVRLQKDAQQLGTLILETKGFDPKEDYKIVAAERWVNAVNHDGKYGRWAYRMTHDPSVVPFLLEDATKELERAH